MTVYLLTVLTGPHVRMVSVALHVCVDLDIVDSFVKHQSMHASGS